MVRIFISIEVSLLLINHLDWNQPRLEISLIFFLPALRYEVKNEKWCFILTFIVGSEKHNGCKQNNKRI